VYRTILRTFIGFICAILPLSVEAQVRVYFGTYTNGESKGIYVADIAAGNGEMTNLRLAAEAKNPSFLAIHPTQRVLYAVGELSESEGGGPSVTAYAIDPATGLLKALNSLSTGGNGPCHVALDPTARWAAVANYGSGSVAVYSLQPSGALLAQVGFRQHQGSGPNPERQEGPHAHCVRFSSHGRLFVTDLGLDQIITYGLLENGALIDGPTARLAPGAGPRHMTFSPDGRHLLVNNELASTVTSFAHDPVTSHLHAIDTETTLPHDFTGSNTTAEIIISPQGDTVYCSNRGHDSIAVLKFDPQTGQLMRTGHIPTQGQTPRNFNLTRDGRLLVVANQSTNDVRPFFISPTGGVTAGMKALQVPSPVCVVFAY
jgi:6-phosphogluconolactonase